VSRWRDGFPEEAWWTCPDCGTRVLRGPASVDHVVYRECPPMSAPARVPSASEVRP